KKKEKRKRKKNKNNEIKKKMSTDESKKKKKEKKEMKKQTKESNTNTYSLGRKSKDKKCCITKTNCCWPSVCFSGCALHVFYQLGVAYIMLLCKIKCERVFCTSAGMATALYYLLELNEVLSINTLLNTLPIHSRKQQIPNTCTAIVKGICFGIFCPNVLQKARCAMIDLLAKTLKEHRP